MYRTTGLTILIVGTLISFSMIFTGFNHAVKSWDIDRDTGDVSQVEIACPAPLGIVFGDAETMADPSWGAPQCASTGQRLFITGSVILAVAVGLGIKGIRKGHRPQKSIKSIPSFGPSDSDS